MAGVPISINLRGLGRFRNLLDTVARGMGSGGTGGGGGAATSPSANRTVLHQRYGIRAMQWVDRNFQTEGGLLSTGRWKRLSANTIIGRRNAFAIHGAARVALILQNTAGSGGLRGSFVMTFSSNEAKVGTAKTYAEFHEKGTTPYTIKPKTAKLLAFPHISGTPLAKAMTFPSVGRKFAKGTPIRYSKMVKHPGLTPRRMLPKAAEILPDLIKTTINFLKELKGRGQTL